MREMWLSCSSLSGRERNWVVRMKRGEGRRRRDGDGWTCRAMLGGGSDMGGTGMELGCTVSRKRRGCYVMKAEELRCERLPAPSAASGGGLSAVAAGRCGRLRVSCSGVSETLRLLGCSATAYLQSKVVGSAGSHSERTAPLRTVPLAHPGTRRMKRHHRPPLRC